MGDKIDKAFDKDTSYRTLELVNSWITAADSKSSILLAFIALLVGLTSNSYSKIVDVILNGNNVSITFCIVIAVLYLIVLVLVIYHLILVFTARLKTGLSIDRTNLVSFISVSNMTDQEYLELTKKTTDADICEMILKQVNVNSKIAYQKMKQFNKALMYSFILIPLTIIMVTFLG
ncbi:Pycsar system effector family protein [Acholeplasma laidlawii]|uniref:Pycsar effector protein domain-containing protein n=2 Tax=Acholeplasma laidlawii TaxID=2148 RepID=A0A553IIE4_ACHLA|nr:Pycsar system effector family protein [Acholeplasma laidlawii]ABX81193.1 hypothetical membrane protein [Acholeplasma laidlawii PG-8A]NWH10235.1 hypothetical protein [Acholeplasma laidlawii]NWH11624.1 hypothetical protein [Acholeplasma laidlawii]NWH12968.1 hypothetical protein [Acholeplasma laidlawii]NWH14432.1 hypothetical protein [Acholeplasma laidlawii]